MLPLGACPFIGGARGSAIAGEEGTANGFGGGPPSATKLPDSAGDLLRQLGCRPSRAASIQRAPRPSPFQSAQKLPPSPAALEVEGCRLRSEGSSPCTERSSRTWASA